MSSSTHLIGDHISGNGKYSDMIAGNDGNLYLVPWVSKQVALFNPKNNDLHYIGPEYDGVCKWWAGVFVDNSKIFCSPFQANGVLVIDTNSCSTELIPLPTIISLHSNYCKYRACTFDDRGSVVFFRDGGSRIMKVNTDSEIH